MAYELMEEEEPSMINEVGRHLGRTASNIATQTIGLPGDIFSLVNEFIARPATEAITGEEGAPYEETYLGKALPTTETHRKNIESVFGEKSRPKNEIEKFADNTIEDLALLTNPAKLLQKGAKKAVPILKNLAKSLGANLAGESVKQVTNSETGGMATKAGALFMLSLMDQESAAKQVGKLYQEANKHLPPNATTNASNLEKSMDALENSYRKNRPLGNLSPQEKFVSAQVDKIRNLIWDDKINVDQAIAQKRSLNKELATLYKEVPKQSDQKSVRNLSKQLNGFLNETIDQYGATNQKFFKPYKDADQAFGTLANSNFLSNWVQNNIVQHPVTSGLIHLFGPVSKGAAIAAVPYQAYKLTYRIAKSPTLAKIYGNTIKAAAKEDSAAFSKYLKQLDDAFQNEESRDRYELLE